MNRYELTRFALVYLAFLATTVASLLTCFALVYLAFLATTVASLLTWWTVRRIRRRFDELPEVGWDPVWDGAFYCFITWVLTVLSWVSVVIMAF